MGIKIAEDISHFIDQDGAAPEERKYDSFDEQFPGIVDTYTIDEIRERIDQSNQLSISGYEIRAPKYLASTCSYEISQMIKGKSYLRLADIWFGKDRKTNVTGISLFSNKHILNLSPLRVDLSLSFSNSLPPVDQVQIEIICHVSKMKSHIQRLAAITEITPTIPLMNPLIASVLQPIIQNKDVYEAYGFKIPDLEDTIKNEKKIIEAYASVPVQVHIDQINLGYIGPRDIRILVMVSRVCNSVAYGIRPLYCQTMRDAVDQHNFLNNFTSGNSDNEQIKAYGTAFNIYNQGIDEMLFHLKQNIGSENDNYAEYKAEVFYIDDGDTASVYKIEDKEKTNPIEIRFFGMDTPETNGFATNCGLNPDADKGADDYYEAQPFAYEAKRYLERLIKENGNIVIVKPWGSDYYGRTLGELYLPGLDNKCANLEVLKAGLAVYNPGRPDVINEGMKKALEKYYLAEIEARERKVGIWSLPLDKIETPSQFRKRMVEKAQRIIKKRQSN